VKCAILGRMARLLILSSDTGEGHNSAANAIQRSALGADWAVSVRKPSEECGSGYRSLNGLYNFLLTYRPGWVGLLARTLDLLKPNEADLCYRLFRNYIGRFVTAEAPDLILSVHPMLNHLIQRWVKEQGLSISCYTFVTDPFPPFWKGWSSPYIERYFVLSDQSGAALKANGVSEDRIERVRMPIGSGFRPHQPEEIATLRAQLELEGDVILVNGGARGGGPVRRLVQTVREAAPEFDVLVVCGHNESLKKQLERIGDKKIRAFGFVRELHPLVGAADLVITKPGALATYEALASQVPTVLTAIGGLMPQESGLFDAASSQGFGYAVRTLDELRTVVSKGVGQWRRKREAIAAFYSPESAPELIERIQIAHASG
jgi:processive 1,2-diacylglycerol beta-glucosyltransferase